MWGLFSGARRLVEALSGDAQVDVRVVPGISSASYLAARLARPWQDWRFASAHGVACDIVAEAERAGELFLATSGGEDPSRLSCELAQAGFGDARVTVAERLSYPDERITCATASEIAGQTFDDLNVMLIEFAGGAGSPVGSSASRAASSRWPYASSGIPDELFIRGDVPMTKQEVRAVALAKLRLTATDTVWDVGAGTGSVSIEAALVARAGSVWAVERNAAGVRLIRENADAFGCGNVHAVPGVAPEALAKLPVPDAVFVGGSAGELPSIVEAALEKNSQVRLCVPCVTVETLTEACALLSGSRFKGFEACQVSAARAEAVGLHHLMKAQNPVFLVSARGAGGVKGLGHVKRNDIVVFNFPAGDTIAVKVQNPDYYSLVEEYGRERILLDKATFGEVMYRPVDKRENYVKRCIGMPGDTLQLIDNQVYIDGKPAENPKDMQFNYFIETDGSPITEEQSV